MKRVVCPYKVILFGEHTVVYGGVAVASSIGLYAITQPSLSREQGSSSKFVNGTLKELKKPLRSVSIYSEAPEGRGLGSSSVVVSSILKLYTDYNNYDIAKKAFEIERGIQGSGSPIDTSTVIQGGIIAVNSNKGKKLWNITHDNFSWRFSLIKTGTIELLVVDTSRRASTMTMVARVKNKIQNDSEIIRRISDLSDQGIKALQKMDLKETGYLMKQNHSELQQLGVSTRTIDKVVDIGNKFAYGAKLSGAGGGGIVVILIDRDRKNDLKKELMGVKGIKMYNTYSENSGIKASDMS